MALVEQIIVYVALVIALVWFVRQFLGMFRLFGFNLESSFLRIQHLLLGSALGLFVLVLILKRVAG